jgi:multisubunit Na+/H+ antiporter MnhB subunit
MELFATRPEIAPDILDRAAAGFGIATVVTIVFNTLLAWVKDAYDPLNTFMAHLTGNHWITHGLVDVILFVVLGGVLTVSGVRVGGRQLIIALTAVTLLSGAGLSLWFLVV